MNGSVIKRGQKVRFHHVGTSKWLHSHLHGSPLTGNQEVSAYGSATKSDSGDHWLVSWDGGAAEWDRSQQVCLQTPVDLTTGTIAALCRPR
jgi:dolichyl-phosphate-mannose--protein O-mannosyl transferase